jgi:hypothetical protein
MKVVHRDALHNDDFEEVNGKLRTKKTSRSYLVTFQNGAQPWNNNTAPGLRKCNIKNSFGIIHLDFKKTNNNPVVAVLPDDCPTPMDLIEDQLHDGNTVYIDAGSRVVRCYGVTNVRYVVNLVGYFNDN